MINRIDAQKGYARTHIAESEQKLMSALVFHPEAIALIADKLNPQALIDDQHPYIYNAILRLHQAKEVISPITIIDDLERHKLLDKAGGSVYIQRLAELPTDLYPEATVKTLMRDWRERSYKYEADKLVNDCVSLDEYRDRMKELDSEFGKPTDRFERVKLELKFCLAESDPIKRAILRSDISRHNGIPIKEVEKLLRDLEVQTHTQKPKILSLAEIFAMESEALTFLVPGFFLESNSALLSGLPGSGKSLFAVDLAYAVATGSEFLGEKTVQGSVLYLCSDEPLNQLANKLNNRGFVDSDPVTVIPDWTIKDLDLLEEAVEAIQPKLIVIDSIRTTIAYPLGLDENNAGIGAYLKKIEAIATRYRGVPLFIHHDNKSKDSVGVCRSSGSTDIPGNVSIVLRLEAASKDPSDPNRILTMPKTRGLAPQSLRVALNLDVYTYDNLGAVGESDDVASETKSLKETITALLSKYPSGLEGTEIQHHLGDNPSIRRVLTRLVERRIVGRRKSKRDPRSKIYYLADLPSLSPPLSPKVSHIMAESIDNKGLEDMGQIWDTSPKNMGQSHKKEGVPHGCPISPNLDTKEDSAEIGDTLTERGGERGVFTPGDRVEIDGGEFCPTNKPSQKIKVGDRPVLIVGPTNHPKFFLVEIDNAVYEVGVHKLKRWQPRSEFIQADLPIGD